MWFVRGDTFFHVSMGTGGHKVRRSYPHMQPTVPEETDNRLVPHPVIGCIKGLVKFLPFTAKTLILKTEVPPLHDAGDSSPLFIQDEYPPALVFPAYVRPRKVHRAEGKSLGIIEPQERAGVLPVCRNLRFQEEPA